MKYLLIALILTLASVTGQLLTVTKVEPPQMVVYYVNEQANTTACTATELLYIDTKITADLDVTLLLNGYLTPTWSLSVNTATRKLATSGANCDFCRVRYPRSMCNSMYNCGYRRQLRKGSSDERDLKTLAELAVDLRNDCQQNVGFLSYSLVLGRTCKTALKATNCFVEFV